MASALKSSTRKKWIAAVAVLAVAVIVVAVYLLMRADPAATASYRTMEVVPASVLRTVGGEASVEAVETFSLFLETAQTVAEVPVKEGDAVSRGQVLIRYDTQRDQEELARQLLEAQLYLENANLALQNIAGAATGNDLLQYENALTSAEKNVTDTQGELESLEIKLRQQKIRTENLRKLANAAREDYNDDYIEREDYDTAATNYSVAVAAEADLEAQIEAKKIALSSYERQSDNARQKLQNAKDPLSDSGTLASYNIQKNLVEVYTLTVDQIQADMDKMIAETVSPADGYVTALNVTAGGTAGTGTAVVTVADASAVRVRFEASEYDAPGIAAGMRAEVKPVGMPDRVYSGVVSKVAAFAREQEDSEDGEMIVPVEISLSDADDALKIGYTVQVDIVLEEKENVLAVPRQAILSENDGQYVLVQVNGHTEKRKVETGFSGDQLVEVTGGLSEGERIVTNPLSA